MDPLSLRLSHCRTFEALDLDFPRALVSLTGPNGSGKSTLVNGVEVALFGPPSRSLADWLTEDSDSTELEIELTFEHGGEVYRARRHYSARGAGKSSFDLEHSVDEWGLVPGSGDREDDEVPIQVWKSLTLERQSETQAELERLLGFSRGTFRASSFLAQGDSAAFTEASAGERKRILAEVLGLSVWERLLKHCRADKTEVEKHLVELTGRISVLNERVDGIEDVRQSLAALRLVAEQMAVRFAAAEPRLTQARESLAALERAETMWATRNAALATARARLDMHKHHQTEAAVAKEIAASVCRELDELPERWQVEELEAHETELRQTLASHQQALLLRERAVSARDLAESDLGSRLTAVAGLEGEIRLAEARLAALDESEEKRCELCCQALAAEALEVTRAQIGSRRNDLLNEAKALRTQIEAFVIPPVPEVMAAPLHDGVPAAAALSDASQRLAEIRKRYALRSTLEERLRGAESRSALVESPEYREELQARERALREAADALAEVSEPEPGAVAQAKTALEEAERGLSLLRYEKQSVETQAATLGERLEQAEKDAEALAAAARESTTLRGRLEDLIVLEQAYGRDGIPALIVEQAAIPAIEVEANRILLELDTSFRVELRTEKMLKRGDASRDTLDIVVAGEAGERDYSTFSGGERSRINLALRLGLARLLAHRRGAESKVLVLDEIEYLDEEGHLRLAEVLRGLQGEYERILVASHSPALRDAFDNALVVRREGNRSYVEAV